MRPSEAPFERANVLHNAASDGVLCKVREIGFEHRQSISVVVHHYLSSEEARLGLVDGCEVVSHERLGRVPGVDHGRRFVSEKHRGATVRAQNHL